MKRPNGAFRALVETGAQSSSDDCLNAGRRRRPTFKLGDRDMNASRAVWWLAHGDPGELKVLHRCGNGQCLNVQHLYLGTIKDNARDTVLMDRCTNQVVPLAVAKEIARRYRPGKAGNGNGNVAELAAEYGVSYAAIRLAAKRIHRLTHEGEPVTTTFAALKERFATTEFVGDFEADFDIPVLTGPQCQGDVSIATPTSLLPRRVTIRDRSVCTPVTKAGVEVIRGGAMNNAHTLRTTDAGVAWYPDVVDDEGLAFGVLMVPDGAVCFLEHVEHGFNGIGAGAFVVGRQREQRDVIALVQD